MLNYLRNIAACDSMEIINEDAYFIQGNEIKTLNVFSDSQPHLLAKLKENMCRLIFADKQIFVVNSENELVGIIKDRIFISEIASNLKDVLIISYSTGYLMIYVKEPERKHGLYDIKKGKLNFLNSKLKFSKIINGIAYTRGDQILAYNSHSGKIEDSFDASIIDKSLSFYEILGVDANNVLATMSDESVVKVDLSNKRYEKWKKFDDKYLSFFTLNTDPREARFASELGLVGKISAKYCEIENKIIGFQYGVYWEIDLKTSKLSAHSLYDEFSSNGISGCWTPMAIKGSTAFFCSDQTFCTNQNHTVISFDLRTKKVINQWVLPKKPKQRRGFIIWGPSFYEPNILVATEQNWTRHLFTITE